MCGNNRSVPDGKREDYQENHTQDTREYFPVHEYRVPCLEGLFSARKCIRVYGPGYFIKSPRPHYTSGYL